MMNFSNIKTIKVKFLLGILVVLILSLISFSYGDDSSISADMFKNIKKEVLPNGLTIITQTNNGPKLVSISMFVNTGSINEDDQINGISHFCEHMFYRGTRERGNIKMKLEIESLGGMLNAETSKDLTRFYVNVPSEHGLKALKIYCDALLNANYLPENIDQERKVILEEYNLRKDNPMTLLHGKLYSLAYKEHPYKRTVIGTEEIIKNLKRQDLLSYKKKWYSPENIVIVLVGNFNREKYVSNLRDIFENIPGGNPGSLTTYPCKKIEQEKSLVENFSFLKKQSFFIMGFHSPGIRDQEDVVAMDLLMFMLGEGENSLLEREICKKQKIGKSLGADFLTSKDPSLIMFHGRVNPKKTEHLKEKILSLLEDIKKGKFSEEDLKRARNMLVRVYLYGLETNSGKAQNLGFYQIFCGIDFAKKYVERISSLKKEDIVKVANKYFNKDYVVYIMAPKKDD